MEDPISVTYLTLAIVAGFFVIFALFWIFVVWLIGLMSGWRSLAQRYPATMPTQGKAYTGQTALMGISRYRNVLTMVTNSSGIFIQPMWLFRIGHPPLFIPWGEFHNPTATTSRWVALTKLEVGMPVQNRIALPPYVLDGEPAAARLAL